MTRKEFILSLFKKDNSAHTCASLCKNIRKKYKDAGSQSRYLSGSVSSLLVKMVRAKLLMYSKETGPRGGYKYLLYDETKIWYEYCFHCTTHFEKDTWICHGCGRYRRERL